MPRLPRKISIALAQDPNKIREFEYLPITHSRREAWQKDLEEGIRRAFGLEPTVPFYLTARQRSGVEAGLASVKAQQYDLHVTQVAWTPAPEPGKEVAGTWQVTY